MLASCARLEGYDRDIRFKGLTDAENDPRRFDGVPAPLLVQVVQYALEPPVAAYVAPDYLQRRHICFECPCTGAWFGRYDCSSCQADQPTLCPYLSHAEYGQGPRAKR